MTKLLIALLIAAPGNTSGKGRAKEAPDGGLAAMVSSMKDPIVVKSDEFEASDKVGQLIYKRNVRVKRANTNMSCDRLIAHYGTGKSSSEREIHRVECEGNVQVRDGNRFARGEHADFDNVRGLLVVTGNPELSQAKDVWMRGDKVVYDVNKDSFTLSGNVTGVLEGAKSGMAPTAPGKDKPKDKDKDKK